MMKHSISRFTKAAALSLGLCALAGGASAASLGLNTQAPSLSASQALVGFLDFGFEGDLSSFDTMVDGADGVAPDGDTALNFAIGYDLADPTGSFFGGFGILDESGEFLRGDVIAVGYTENVVEFQFGNLEGAAANEFGASVLMEIMFSDPLGDNPFASFADATLYRAAITVSDVAPIPLPAGLPLLLSALGGAFVLRHTRRS